MKRRCTASTARCAASICRSRRCSTYTVSHRGRCFPNCYVALGTLHALYKPMPGKFKDYIAIPKMNGSVAPYDVVGPFGTPMEFQVRTQEGSRRRSRRGRALAVQMAARI